MLELVVVFWHISVDNVLIGVLFSGLYGNLYVGLIHRFGEPAVRRFSAMRQHCGYLSLVKIRVVMDMVCDGRTDKRTGQFKPG